MSFFSGLKDFFMEFIEEGEPGTTIRWNIVAPRIDQVLTQLRRITSKSFNCSQKNCKIEIRRLIDMVKDLNPILDKQRILCGNDPQVYHHLRTFLLEIWQNLLLLLRNNVIFKKKNLELSKMGKRIKPESSPFTSSVLLASFLTLNDISVIQIGIIAILSRKEFFIDNTLLNSETSLSPNNPSSLIAYRYRAMLFRTQAQIQDSLNLHVI